MGLILPPVDDNGRVDRRQFLYELLAAAWTAKWAKSFIAKNVLGEVEGAVTWAELEALASIERQGRKGAFGAFWLDVGADDEDPESLILGRTRAESGLVMGTRVTDTIESEGKPGQRNNQEAVTPLPAFMAVMPARDLLHGLEEGGQLRRELDICWQLRQGDSPFAYFIRRIGRRGRSFWERELFPSLARHRDGIVVMRLIPFGPLWDNPWHPPHQQDIEATIVDKLDAVDGRTLCCLVRDAQTTHKAAFDRVLHYDLVRTILAGDDPDRRKLLPVSIYRGRRLLKSSAEFATHQIVGLRPSEHVDAGPRTAGVIAGPHRHFRRIGRTRMHGCPTLNIYFLKSPSNDVAYREYLLDPLLPIVNSFSTNTVTPLDWWSVYGLTQGLVNLRRRWLESAHQN